MKRKTGCANGGRKARFAKAGDVVQVEVPAEVPRCQRAGTELWHMSSLFLDLPQPKESGFSL